jgi:hypothetical protein
MSALPEGCEDLLANVLGQMAISNRPERGGVNHAKMFGHQFPEGFLRPASNIFPQQFMVIHNTIFLNVPARRQNRTKNSWKCEQCAESAGKSNDQCQFFPFRKQSVHASFAESLFAQNLRFATQNFFYFLHFPKMGLLSHIHLGLKVWRWSRRQMENSNLLK